MISHNRITLFIVSFALFMDVLDSNVINTAIPAMSKTFQTDPVDLKVALISYLVSLAIFIPISGWVADKYGAKHGFIAAFGLFTLSSFFCGNAHTLHLLVIFRFFQGIGGAFMISLGRLILARTFARHELVEAMNTVITVVSLGVMLGPFVGGVIVDHLSWPWIFYLNIPIGILAMILASYFLKDFFDRESRPFDLIGFILFGSSLVMCCLGLSKISETSSRLLPAIMMLIISAILLILYILFAKRTKHPVINISLFHFRTFRTSVFGNLCARLGFGGMPFLLPLFQQLALGFSAQLSGLLLVPIAIGVIISKTVASKVLKKTGYKKYLLVNTFFVGFILWIFQVINVHTPIYFIALLTCIFGFFISSQYTAMNSLAFAEISNKNLSSSTSITTTTQIMAQSFGVAVSAILLKIFSYFSPHLLLTSTVFHHVFFTLGVLTFFSSLIFIQLKPNDGKQMLVKEVEVDKLK